MRASTSGPIASLKAFTVSTRTQSRRREVKVRIEWLSPQADSPCARMSSASFSTSSTRRLSDQESVDSDTSTRIVTARSCTCGRLIRWMRSLPWPPAARSVRARTTASRSRSVPSSCARSISCRGRSTSNWRRTRRIRLLLSSVSSVRSSWAEAGVASTRQWSLKYCPVR
ncbi:hypothetical protein D9M70_458250 [compost metagenome]